MRNRLEAFEEFFASSLWDDIVELIDDELAGIQAALEDVDTTDREMRIAQGGMKMGNRILDLPENVEEIIKEKDRMKKEVDGDE